MLSRARIASPCGAVKKKKKSRCDEQWWSAPRCVVVGEQSRAHELCEWVIQQQTMTKRKGKKVRTVEANIELQSNDCESKTSTARACGVVVKGVA
jgi:hypothetical protein